uniref:Uncharacterized protein n=1 Tax=Spongospora subterranea TaxID=70186 RepID=A0A0H5QKL1_9EUKA|eukprot:CRZ01846.1 hypothetical protein [Spongospora subterranea]
MRTSRRDRLVKSQARVLASGFEQNGAREIREPASQRPTDMDTVSRSHPRDLSAIQVSPDRSTFNVQEEQNVSPQLVDSPHSPILGNPSGFSAVSRHRDDLIIMRSHEYSRSQHNTFRLQDSFPFEIAQHSFLSEGSFIASNAHDVWKEFLIDHAQSCLKMPTLPQTLRRAVTSLVNSGKDPYRLRLCLLCADQGFILPMLQPFLKQFN